MLKYAVDLSLNNIESSKDELHLCIEKVLRFKSVRDKFMFDEVKPALKDIGLKKILLTKTGLEFIGI